MNNEPERSLTTTPRTTRPWDGPAWNWRGWTGLLELGRRYGWIPAGTEPPLCDEGGPWDGGPWNGTYFSNSGQRVTTEDAHALADALEQALPDMPDEDAVAHKMVIVARWHDGTPRRAAKPGAELSLLERFAAGQQKLREFIAFCRAEEFAIW